MELTPKMATFLMMDILDNKQRTNLGMRYEGIMILIKEFRSRDYRRTEWGRNPSRSCIVKRLAARQQLWL